MTAAPTWAPPAYEPGPAVRALAVLGAEACSGDLGRCLPPHPDVPPEDREWFAFVMHSSSAPLVLMACGVAAVVVSIPLLCRSLAAPPDKSCSRSQFLAMGLVFLLSCLAAGLSLQSALRAYERGGVSFRHAVDGFREAESMLRYTGDASAKLGRQVRAMNTACPHLEELFSRYVDAKGWDDFRTFQECGRLVKEARADIEALPSLLDGIERRTSGWPDFLVFCLLTPAKVFGVGVFLVSFLALLRVSCERKAVATAMGDLSVALGFITMVVLMLTAVCGSAAVLGLTVASGSFCLDPGGALPYLAHRSLHGAVDAGALRAAESYFATDAAPRARATPGAQNLEAARHHAQNATSAMESRRRQLDMLELFCDDVYRMRVRSSLVGLERNTSEAVHLLSGGNVYKHFQQVVGRSICGTALEALILLVVFQAWIGLVVLPLLAAPVLVFLWGDRVQMAPPAYDRLQEAKVAEGRVAFGSTMSGTPTVWPGASPPVVVRFDSALSSITEGNGMSSLQHHPQGFGSQVMNSGSGAMHSGSHVMNSSSSMMHGPVPDSSLMSFVPSKRGPPSMSLQQERHVRWADEVGRSLFGSQASALSSVRSAATPSSSGFG